MNKWLLGLCAVVVVWGLQESRFYFPKRIRPPKGIDPVTVEMKTTSYCHCRRCCSYKWMLFIPYQKKGTFKYRIKHVGITASGVLARPGTIAADTSIYPHGTVMHIPGYGYARVEDTGGAIKGQHIDLYRPNHWYARHWGVRTKSVRVWLPDPPVSEVEAESEPPAEESKKTADPAESIPEELPGPPEKETADFPDRLDEG